jgi:hypothetical protein
MLEKKRRDVLFVTQSLHPIKNVCLCFKFSTSLIISVFGMQLLKDPFCLPPQQRDIPGYVLSKCLPVKLEMSPCPIAATSSPIIISDDDSLPDLDEDKPKKQFVYQSSESLYSDCFLRLACTRPTSKYG